MAFASAHEGTQGIYVLHAITLDIVRHNTGGDSQPSWLKRQ